MTSKTTNKSSPEVRQRAVRMVLDHERNHPWWWAAVLSIAEDRLRAADAARVADEGGGRLLKPRSCFMLPRTRSMWQRDSQSSASSEPGAAHIATLADLCHARGVLLICDAAWGVASAFCEALPHDALTKSADVAVYSLRKTMGALTQGSALLARGALVDQQRLWMAYELYETTSPSVPVLASLDAARRDHADC